MKFILMRSLVLFSGLLLLAGCSDSGFEMSKKERAAFDKAAPEIKKVWEEALQADHANDYTTASTKYRSLLGLATDPDQLVAVQTALGGFNIRLNEAAAKGDAAAQQALKAAQTGSPRR